MSREEKLVKALLWIIYEQCVYDGKAYAKLMIHGKEAFEAVGLPEVCDVKEIEKMLFCEGDM